jgi:hypothetical protein
VQNSTFKEPSLDFELVSIDHQVLVVNFSSSGGSLSSNRTQVMIFEKNATDHSKTVRKILDGAPNGRYEFDISGLNGTLVFIASLLVMNTDTIDRETSKSVELEKPIPPVEVDNGGGSTQIWIVPILLVLVLLIILAVVLLVVEKTSFAIQTFVYRGGVRKDEEVLTVIHDRPGIAYRELSASISLSRRDLVTTLVGLEKDGHLTGVPDGVHVRFLPTVGSFVDGPLVLNRFQMRMAKVLLGRKKIGHQELSDETGISKTKLEREASLMELKGALSMKHGSEEMEYYLTSRQKRRIEEWMRGRE